MSSARRNALSVFFVFLLTPLLPLVVLTAASEDRPQVHPQREAQPIAPDAAGQWIRITKSPDPGYVEAGGAAQFTIAVANTSNQYALRDVVVSDPLVSDCSLPIGALAPGATFAFACAQNNVRAAFTNVAQVTAVNATTGRADQATDDARVELVQLTVDLIANPPSVPEPGGKVRFSLTVDNSGSTPTQLTALDSPELGSLTAPDNPLLEENSCAALDPLPVLSPDGAPLSCSFVAPLQGAPGSKVITVTAGGRAGEEFAFVGIGAVTVFITDSVTNLQATLATDSVAAALGSRMNFVVTLRNDSAADTVTLTTMLDNELGDVTSQGDCVVPLLLSPGESYSCQYQQILSGPVDTDRLFTFSTSGTNDDDPPQIVGAQASTSVFIFQPVALLPFAATPINDRCAAAVRLTLNTPYEFTPSIVDAWYTFDLQQTSDLEVLMTNYKPRIGQLVVYSATGAQCRNLRFEKNDGGFLETKRVALPSAAPNRYYVRVFTDAPLDFQNPYTLLVNAR